MCLMYVDPEEGMEVIDPHQTKIQKAAQPAFSAGPSSPTSKTPGPLPLNQQSGSLNITINRCLLL